MSRTYRRRDHVERDCNCGAPVEPKTTYSYKKGVFIIKESVQEAINQARRKGFIPDRTCDCDTWFHEHKKRNFKRDRKDYDKPDKAYKKVTKKIRKAKEKAAMDQKRYDCMPIFKKTNVWDWN